MGKVLITTVALSGETCSGTKSITKLMELPTPEQTQVFR